MFTFVHTAFKCFSIDIYYDIHRIAIRHEYVWFVGSGLCGALLYVLGPLCFRLNFTRRTANSRSLSYPRSKAFCRL